MSFLHRALERAQSDGAEIKSTVLYTVVPSLQEQIGSVEALVTAVEKVAYSLTSKVAVGSSGAMVVSAPLTPPSQTRYSHRGSSAGQTGGGGELIDLSQGQPLSSSYYNNSSNHNNNNQSQTHTSGNNSKATVSLDAIAEAVVLVDGLKSDMERLQMGITLMTLSVRKLVDIVQMPGQSSWCCGLEGWVGGSYTASEEAQQQSRLTLETIAGSSSFAAAGGISPMHGGGVGDDELRGGGRGGRLSSALGIGTRRGGYSRLGNNSLGSNSGHGGSEKLRNNSVSNSQGNSGHGLGQGTGGGGGGGVFSIESLDDDM